ncbi:MAG: hypothetical protein AB8B65_07370 [Kordia sp.]
MELLKKYQLSAIVTAKVFGGNGGNTSEDVPITTLGTISHDGEG